MYFHDYGAVANLPLADCNSKQGNRLRPLCALPSSPSRRQAMRPIINTSEEDRATNNKQHAQKFGKDRTCDSGDILADRQTH